MADFHRLAGHRFASTPVCQRTNLPGDRIVRPPCPVEPRLTYQFRDSGVLDGATSPVETTPDRA
ncbi:hypothetical protein RRSWK_02913 [Rhodopirellula sp. SWK7]|nr:hypothetical protein RRSWK_02913 [Rhodopirellula sp. SWK7]